jgi:hypothetical protein
VPLDSRGGLPISYLRRPQSTCPRCGRSLYEGSLSRTCKRHTCPGYVDVWTGDQRVRLLENLLAYGGLTCMLTPTAPRADALPCDKQAWAPPRAAPPLGHAWVPRRGDRVAALQRGLDARVVGAVERRALRVNREHGTGAASLPGLRSGAAAARRDPHRLRRRQPTRTRRPRRHCHDQATIGAGYGWGRVHLPDADEARKQPMAAPPAASRCTKRVRPRAT